MSADQPVAPLLLRTRDLLLRVARPMHLDFREQRAAVRQPAYRVSSRRCLPKEYGGYKEVATAWDNGVCLTEEQVWCRKNGDMHPDCRAADCRAEEVRISLEGTKQEPVFSGCPEGDVLQIYHNSAPRGRAAYKEARGGSGSLNACVPPGDKRAWLLPACTDAEARARSRFYDEQIASHRLRTKPRLHTAGRNHLRAPRPRDPSWLIGGTARRRVREQYLPGLGATQPHRLPLSAAGIRYPPQYCGQYWQCESWKNTDALDEDGSTIADLMFFNSPPQSPVPPLPPSPPSTP